MEEKTAGCGGFVGCPKQFTSCGAQEGGGSGFLVAFHFSLHTANLGQAIQPPPEQE